MACTVSSAPSPKPVPKEQGCVWGDKLLAAVKRRGKTDVTRAEAQDIRLSECLCYRDAHGYAFFFFFCLNGSTGGKAGRKALCRFQNAGARWALGTESQVPTETTESSPALPTKSPVEKGSRTEAKGVQPADGWALHPLQWLSPHALGWG